MPPRNILFKLRLTAYLGLWVLAMLAFASFIDPRTVEGTNQWDLRAWWQMAVYTPYLAVFGFGIFTDWFHATRGSRASVDFYAYLGVWLLAVKRPSAFYICCGLQALVFAISAICFIRWARLMHDM